MQRQEVTRLLLVQEHQIMACLLCSVMSTVLGTHLSKQKYLPNFPEVSMSSSS